MAERPVFTVLTTSPYYREEPISFQYYSGFAESQKKKSIVSLHSAFIQTNPQEKVLEISTKSDNQTGIMLSAFNLMIHTLDNRCYSVESAFQSSKVFENGGPYKDLLEKSPRDAKKDIRLKQSGKLKSFYFSKKTFPLEPKNYFYNWLYINALNLDKELSEKIMEYSAFTDIEFNPRKSINCQACAAAIFVSLKKCGLLSEALKSPQTFLNVVYKNEVLKNTGQVQLEILAESI